MPWPGPVAKEHEHVHVRGKHIEEAKHDTGARALC